MHGLLEGEQRPNRRHMWPVPTPTSSSVAVSDSVSISTDSFVKDGRMIHVGDCALFKPPQDSPPFIGIIHRLIFGKEDTLSLRVNWLYRPADVKLGKGTLLEAAPNEVFYSFHNDEIPAASLLHPCKVAFLHKGVELPSGLSAFVCRRVYDIENKCLWWLTDKDFINERQEEIDQLLDKTQLAMYGAVPSGGRSPRPLNGSTGTPQLKHGADSVQNSSSSFPSQVKGIKRECGDQGSDPVKRERLSKTDNADSGHFRSEHILKSEIAKITDNGGLTDFEGVEKLVQLMQPNGTDKKIDLACRLMLIDVIIITDRFDCLKWFVQLRGLPVLDEWLQEVHRGKIGDGSSPRESDKSMDEFLLALLRALDKLPVNLHALQTCNVGKSVNHLRTHKNSEIQKKARSLVDMWKKRVEAEMNIIDAKSGSSRGGSWPTKSVVSDVSQVGSRRTSASFEVGVKSSVIQSSASKSPPVKLGSSEAVTKYPLASPGSTKNSSLASTSGGVGTKDPNSTSVGVRTNDLPLTAIKEEKSSSSSQSQNNSQSCSSDQPKIGAAYCREDAPSSTAGSPSVNRISRNRKSSNGHGTAVSVVQKGTSSGKINSLNRNLDSEKMSPTRVTCERASDVPHVDNGNGQRLIVRLPSTARSPTRSSGGDSLEDPSATFCKASSQAHSEKHDHHDWKVKGKGDILRASSASNVNMDPGHDGLSGSHEVNAPSIGALCDERSRDGEDGEKTEASKTTCLSSRISPKQKKSHEASFSSMNALIESCAKFSEASAPASIGDDVGMNLLASVAAGEISRYDVSPLGSPGRQSPAPEDSCAGDDVRLRRSDEDRAQGDYQNNDGTNGDAMAEQGNSVDSLRVKNIFPHHSMPAATNFFGDEKVASFGYEEKTGECSAQLNSSGTVMLQKADESLLTSDGKASELVHDASLAMSSVEESKVDDAKGEAADQFHEQRESAATCRKNESVSNSKLKARSPLFDKDKNVGYADEKGNENGVVILPEAASTDARFEKEVNEESSPPRLSSEIHGEVKNVVHNISVEQKPPHMIGGKTEGAAPSGSCNVSDVELKTEKVDDMKAKIHFEQNEKQKMDIGSSDLDHTSNYTENNSEGKKVIGHLPSGPSSHEEPPAIPVQDTDVLKSSGCELDVTEKLASPVPTARSEVTVKLDFDLNQGFPIDDGSQEELVKLSVPGTSSAVHLSCPLAVPISSMTGNFPASITVAAAAKGPFVLPENPLRSKGEPGWKGSAATSAFRPAEPRKVLEMPLSPTNVPLDNTAGRHSRPLLDIDLNMPDQRVLEDVATQSSTGLTCLESGPRDHCGGGLDLDLNRVDESTETGQLSASNSGRWEILQLPSRSPLSAGLSNANSNAARGFDLNNGPGHDESSVETARHAKSSTPFLSTVSGVKINNMDIGNFSSWFPQGASYSAISIPSIHSGRGEHGVPVVPPTGSQRILGPPIGGVSSFNPEVYRGAVLSSSPAVAFPPATPFQYAGFPFDTNFPFSSNSYSACSTPYMDSSSGGQFCFPGIPSQFVGPTGVVSTHYPRPYIMSLAGGTSNIGPESRKYGSQGLDLNAGPGSSDVECRDERFPSALRQLPVAGSQGLTDEQLKMYQMAAGIPLKRKEPDGGRDGDRIISYKQSSWQ